MGIGSPKKKEEVETEQSEGSSNDQNVVGIKRAVSPSDMSPVVEHQQPIKKSRLTATRKSNPPSQPQTLTKVDPEPEQRSLYDTEPIVESGPIIETGPVEADEEVQSTDISSGIMNDIFPFQDEISDFSDDDEPVKSAAELLSQQFGSENGYGEEEDYY